MQSACLKIRPWKFFEVLTSKPGPRACYHTRNGIYGYKPAAWKNKLDLGLRPKGPSTVASEAHCRLQAWINAYRQHGHKIAALDPLALQEPSTPPELDPARYGLSLEDTTSHDVSDFLQADAPSSLSEVEALLHKNYCGYTAAEFMHLKTEEERQWFAERFEKVHEEDFSSESKKELAIRMAKSQVFENFLAIKRQSLKRYGGEGSESQIAFFLQAFQQCADAGVEEVFVCMAHRGRLNLLIDFFGFSPTVMFRKIDGFTEFPSTASCWGDVVSHLYCSRDIDYNGHNLHVNFLPNPSHLEGVIGEGFCIAEVPHFNIGGTVHLIINNQLGFTTPEDRGRSSDYSSDIAKMNGNPVIHVNGDHPEEVVRACKVALDYRNTFRKDVVVDMVCYRLNGHNELDDPSMTQPIMYDAIKSKKSVPDRYSDKLVREGHMTEDELHTATTDHYNWLSNCLKDAETQEPEAFHLQGRWAGLHPPPKFRTSWNTGVDTQLLQYIGIKSVNYPEHFHPHPGVLRSHIHAREKKITAGSKLDWATAEALAFGSLLSQGFPIRISGQDVGRGTFSHRHAALVDYKSEDLHIPLNHMMNDQKAFLEVVNSPLSELAVLGFEYGMSIESPNRLVIWEAQFGDFFNTAQVIIDTFVTTGEGKWLLQSGLVMLLPHGMDGAGPEHSSCRIERFLQMSNSEETKIDTDDVNFHFCFPTTPAQYFHLLRRQMIRNFRKPLIIASPKGILRLPAATSSLSDMGPGTTFRSVLSDDAVNPSDVKKVIFCSGKHYYALEKERNDRQLMDTALVRLESLCPFPTMELQQELNKYSSATEYIWSQEEHRNMGAWSFVSPRFENLVGCQLKYSGRAIMGASAVGVGKVHKVEAELVIKEPFQL
ncbi:putative 2-oxoglutarate dehydrogenase E1 component DHKTD1, mitochondrial-like [Apostichopus japonicus]|uniref:Putative 2-oxoglutarate dehydrogenase E1 component DHKTD1, mitochondrial-like n=1 Tax=Stichopus japonicus TaxID=307972 RepID=A0A2G8K7X1_STIJA|nr:putative 2-oxoglutarate dehydrogenase E1 component DHKTD1, mitochondrial-like [Apostichopus japonicus]